MKGDNHIIISHAESGQKLLRFLERKSFLPRSLLFRLLRTGQVRVNGSRCKAEFLLSPGDILRLPPNLAALTAQTVEKTFVNGAEFGVWQVCQDDLGADLSLVFQNETLLVLAKSSGLATQGGSKIVDSVSARLRSACPVNCYVPAPAHRLDKASSGLLLAGKTYAFQVFLHTLLQENKEDLERDYLCWAAGDFSTVAESGGKDAHKPVLLEDKLIQSRGTDGMERMYALPADRLDSSAGYAAKAFFSFLELRAHPCLGQVSLIKARLLTGRKHQIRVQLASRGFPLIGDSRYGGPAFGSMFLHAARLSLPVPASFAPAKFTSDRKLEFALAPLWKGFFSTGQENAV